MKKVEITVNEKGKIDVNFSGIFSHKDLRNLKRSLEVCFRRHHYGLTHSKNKETLKV